jgi:hypothetical protein
VAWEGSEWAAHGEQEAAAEFELAGAVEDEVWRWEDEIGRAVEHQWITVVLWEHWIGAEQRQRRLSTVGSGGAGGPVRDRARGRGNAAA